jgi:pyruvate dehydrogenase E2 component (dihydrolipoamide acetyltransferase)
MVRSKFTAPHFTVVEEVDVTELVACARQAKAIGAESGVKVTFMPFIMKACALGLAKYPMLNGHLDEATQEIVRCGYVNLGIAMDTDNGLIVPVVKEVQSKGILQLAQELNELAERTRPARSSRTTSRARPSRSRTRATSAASSRRRSSTSPTSRSWACTAS